MNITNAIYIDYIELTVPNLQYGLKANYPYRFIKGYGLDSLMMIDNECRKFSILKKDVKTYYSITGSNELWTNCNYNETFIKRINKKDKTKFGIIQTLLLTTNQQMLDSNNNVILEPGKEYIVKSIDNNKKIYRIYGDGCENYTIHESAVLEIKLENITTSFYKNCENSPNVNNYIYNVRKQDLTMEKLQTLSIIPQSEDIDLNDVKKTRGLNDLIELTNELKSSIVKIQLATPITETITRTATRTSTRTITSSVTTTKIEPTTVKEILPPVTKISTKTITSSSVTTKIQPTTVKEMLPPITRTVLSTRYVNTTETKTNNYTSTKYSTRTSTFTATLPASTSTTTETKLQTTTQTVATPSLIISMVTKVVEKPYTVPKIIYNTLHYTRTLTDTSTEIRPTTLVTTVTEKQQPITIQNVKVVNITQTLNRNLTQTEKITETVKTTVTQKQPLVTVQDFRKVNVTQTISLNVTHTDKITDTITTTVFKPQTTTKTEIKTSTSSITQIIPTTKTIEKERTITKFGYINQTINATQTETATAYVTKEIIKPMTVNFTIKDTVTQTYNFTLINENTVTELTPSLLTSFSTIENIITKTNTEFIDKHVTLTKTETKPGPTVTLMGDNVTIFFNFTTTVPDIITSYISIHPINNLRGKINEKCLDEPIPKVHLREKRNQSERMMNDFITNMLKDQQKLYDKVFENPPENDVRRIIEDQFLKFNHITNMPPEVMILYLEDSNELSIYTRGRTTEQMALEWFNHRVGQRKDIGEFLLMRYYGWIAETIEDKINNYEIESNFWTDSITRILKREGYNKTFVENKIKEEKVRRLEQRTTDTPFTTTTENPEIVLRRQQQIQTRKNETISKIEEFLVEKHHLENKTFLSSSAAFGIQYTKFGHLYAFGEDFILMMKLDMPMNKLEIPPDLSEDSCKNLIKLLPKVKLATDRDQHDKINKALEQACDEFDKTMSQLQNQMQETANRAVREFEIRQMSRTKRVEPVTLAIGAAVVWGVWMTAEVINGRHERKELFRKTMELEFKIDKLAGKIETLSETFLGYVEETAKVFKEFDQKIELLRNFTIEQGRQMALAIENAVSFLDYKQTYIGLISVINSYRLAQSNIMQNKMILILDLIQSIESIYNTLSTGRLSHQLLPWKNLKKILDDIESRYSKDFELAITSAEKHLYYTFPLISHYIDPETNAIFLNLRIPLTRRQRIKYYEIVKLQARPFVCESGDCFTIGNESQAIQFVLPQRLLLIMPNTGELMNEIDYDAMHCQYVGHKQLCHTFAQNTLYEPSECTKAIYGFKPKEMMRHCKTIQKNKNEYTPIPIDPNTYMFHRETIPHYFRNCRGKRSERMILQNWSQVVELEKGCDLTLPNGRQIYAPVQYPLRSRETMNITTYHGELLDLIEKASNETKFEFQQLGLDHEKSPVFKGFKPEEHEVTVNWDDKTLTKYAKYLYTVNRNITDVIDSMRNIRNKDFFSFSWKGTIASISSLIQLMSVFAVIFGVLSHSKLLTHTFTISILAPRRVSAYVLPLTGPLLETDYQTIFDIFTLVLLTTLIIVLIKMTFFRKHIISTHYIDKNPPGVLSTNFTVIVNFQHIHVRLCHIHIENCYIHIPIKNTQGNNIKEIRAPNLVNTWIIKDDSGKKIFKLAEDVELIIISQQGKNVETIWFPVYIEIDKMYHHYMPKPMALEKFNNYGIAFVTVKRENEIDTSSKTTLTSMQNETRV